MPKQLQTSWAGDAQLREHLRSFAAIDDHRPAQANNPNSENFSWSAHGRILPYLEQNNIYSQVNLSLPWDNQMVIDKIKLNVFSCPSDPKAQTSRDFGVGRPILFPTTVGFNFGDWFVFDPVSFRGGNGMFYPNSFTRLAQVTDGTSQTLLAAEVKAWTPYLRNGGSVTSSIPASVQELVLFANTAPEFRDTGHTEWPDGRSNHTGFTSAMAPNSYVPIVRGGVQYDTDFNSWLEGKNGIQGRPSYAAITARSYHSGIVNTVRADGSVASASSTIGLAVWRALSTRSGDEVTTE